jgi:hypothetical protein
MYTQHYACVLLENILAWMAYFTHHKHTGAYHNACIDVK